jgi:hypothetical protein
MDDDLPTDLVIPERMLERQSGSTSAEDYIPMQRCRVLPEETPTEILRFWQFQNNIIKFVGSTADRGVILYYKKVMDNVTEDDDAILLLQAQNYLVYRTAALAALYMGEDQERADRLNADADKSMELMLATSVKDNQSFPTRQRRYSSKFKRYYRRIF